MNSAESELTLCILRPYFHIPYLNNKFLNAVEIKEIISVEYVINNGQLTHTDL